MPVRTAARFDRQRVRTDDATDPGTTGGPSVVDQTDVCLGLAVLAARDGSACQDVAAERVGNGSTAGTTGAEPLALATEAAGGSGDGSGTLAFTGTNSVLLALAGAGSVVGGFLIRRAARARLLA